jgi:hypothetical protein
MRCTCLSAAGMGKKSISLPVTQSARQLMSATLLPVIQSDSLITSRSVTRLRPANIHLSKAAIVEACPFSSDGRHGPTDGLVTCCFFVPRSSFR